MSTKKMKIEHFYFQRKGNIKDRTILHSVLLRSKLCLKNRGQIVLCIGNPIIIMTQFHKKVQLEPFYSKEDIRTINTNVNYIY